MRNKRRYNRAGNIPTRRVICPVEGRICSEHILTIVRLYEIDNMSLSDIAVAFGTSNMAVSRILQRYRRYREQVDDERDYAALRYMMRVQQFDAVLNLLDKKRRMPYKVVHIHTKLNTREIKEIARRNGLER